MTTVNPQDNIDIKQFVGKWITVIPIIGSILAYTLAFVHEVAYCNVYHIPVEFISLNWTTIVFALIAGSVGLMLAVYAYFMLFWMPKYSKKQTGSIKKRIYFIITLLLVLFMFSLFLTINELMYSLIALLFCGIVLFIFPLFNKEARVKKGNNVEVIKDKKCWLKSLFQRITSLLKRYRQILNTYDEQQKLPDSKYPKYIYNMILVLFFIVLVFVGVYLEGRQEAGMKNEFYIPSTNLNSIVLKIYSDNAICAPFMRLDDGKSIVIDRKFFIINLGDNPNTELINVTFNGTIKIKTDPYQLQ